MAKIEKAASEKGFTVIEVMLVLAITGLLLLGVLGNAFSSINFQRYQDSVNAFAENLRRVYNEVLNPRSEHFGNSQNDAIYGKMIVFDGSDDGEDAEFYTVTLVGNVDPPKKDMTFAEALGSVDIRPDCSTFETHTVAWGSRIYNDEDSAYKGSVIIARSPSSGAVHTISYDGTFDMDSVNTCNANLNKFTDDIKDMTNDTSEVEYSMTENINFCVHSTNNIVRAVQIKADGSNTSAVTVLDEEETRKAGCS